MDHWSIDNASRNPFEIPQGTSWITLHANGVWKDGHPYLHFSYLGTPWCQWLFHLLLFMPEPIETLYRQSKRAFLPPKTAYQKGAWLLSDVKAVSYLLLCFPAQHSWSARPIKEMLFWHHVQRFPRRFSAVRRFSAAQRLEGLNWIMHLVSKLSGSRRKEPKHLEVH